MKMVIDGSLHLSQVTGDFTGDHDDVVEVTFREEPKGFSIEMAGVGIKTTKVFVKKRSLKKALELLLSEP